MQFFNAFGEEYHKDTLNKKKEIYNFIKEIDCYFDFKVITSPDDVKFLRQKNIFSNPQIGEERGIEFEDIENITLIKIKHGFSIEKHTLQYKDENGESIIICNGIKFKKKDGELKIEIQNETEQYDIIFNDQGFIKNGVQFDMNTQQIKENIQTIDQYISIKEQAKKLENKGIRKKDNSFIAFTLDIQNAFACVDDRGIDIQTSIVNIKQYLSTCDDIPKEFKELINEYFNSENIDYESFNKLINSIKDISLTTNILGEEYNSDDISTKANILRFFKLITLSSYIKKHNMEEKIYQDIKLIDTCFEVIKDPISKK